MIKTVGVIVGAAFLAAAGCTTPPRATPADMDIDLMRGCWVEKDKPGGEIQAFLRLLPKGGNLEGRAAGVNLGSWSVEFSFARSGISATFRDSAMPTLREVVRVDSSSLPNSFAWAKPKFGGKLVAYADAPPSRNFLFAEAGGDRLHIWQILSSADSMLILTVFDGERDGCD